MRIHYLQHVPFEGLGAIETYLKGHTISSTKFFEEETLPNPDAIDFLIIMGGPMGVYDTDMYPWLEQEAAFIKDVIERHKPVLGICLGAQLIAHALGKKVYKNEEKEIGWFDIEPTEALRVSQHRQLLKEKMTVFQWHGDTFDLPDEAIHLATSEGCKNQGFIYQECVIGLQFHIEMTEESIAALVKNGADELVEGKYIQNSDTLFDGKIHFENNHQCLREMIQHLMYENPMDNLLTLRELKDYLLSFTGSYEDYPFDEVTPVYKVNKKMFALLGWSDGYMRINLKCDPDEALTLRDIHNAIIPGYHMNKKHWNTVIIDGSLDKNMIFDMIDHSFSLVAKRKK